MEQYINIFFKYLKIVVFFLIGCITVASFMILVTSPLALADQSGDWHWYLAYIPLVFAGVAIAAWFEYRDKRGS